MEQVRARRGRGRYRGHRSKKVKPDTSHTSGKRGLAEDEDADLIAHKVYLAVDCHAVFQQQPYNNVRVPIQMSKADRNMHPQIYEAFEAAKVVDGNPNLELSFNAPRRPPSPDINDNLERLASPATLKLKQSTFFERLQNEHRFNITVNLNGYVYRTIFRRGRHIPLTLDNSMIVLNVEKDGSGSSTRKIETPGGLFGYPDLNGKFTILLKWYGPDLAFNCLQMYKKLAEEIPKDVSIELEDGQIFEIHSSLLKACSPVFTAMLESNMTEGQTKMIQMGDVNAAALETFFTFLTEGTFLGAFENCDTCFKLFMLSHKYDINVLEKATKTLLEVKPIEWFETSTAMEIASFVSVLPGAENLYERIQSILQSRKEEVQKLENELLEELGKKEGAKEEDEEEKMEEVQELENELLEELGKKEGAEKGEEKMEEVQELEQELLEELRKKEGTEEGEEKMEEVQELVNELLQELRKKKEGGEDGKFKSC